MQFQGGNSPAACLSKSAKGQMWVLWLEIRRCLLPPSLWVCTKQRYLSVSCSSECSQDEGCDMWEWELGSMLQNWPQPHYTVIGSHHWGKSLHIPLVFIYLAWRIKGKWLFLCLSTEVWPDHWVKLEMFKEQTILGMARDILAFPASCRVPMFPFPWPFP